MSIFFRSQVFYFNGSKNFFLKGELIFRRRDFSKVGRGDFENLIEYMILNTNYKYIFEVPKPYALIE